MLIQFGGITSILVNHYTAHFWKDKEYIMSRFYNEMVQGIEILPCRIEGPVYPAYSILWSEMTWGPYY